MRLSHPPRPRVELGKEVPALRILNKGSTFLLTALLAATLLAIQAGAVASNDHVKDAQLVGLSRTGAPIAFLDMQNTYTLNTHEIDAGSAYVTVVHGPPVTLNVTIIRDTDYDNNANLFVLWGSLAPPSSYATINDKGDATYTYLQGGICTNGPPGALSSAILTYTANKNVTYGGANAITVSGVDTYPLLTRSTAAVIAGINAT